MPTVYQSKMDGSEAVRYFHVNLTGLYLGISRRNIEAALTAAESDDGLRGSVVGITFAVMALEAFANELAEDVIPEKERKEFERLDGRFKSAARIPKALLRYTRLLEEKGFGPLPDALASALSGAIALRNKLVHYRLHDTAGKAYYPTPRRTPTRDGGGMISINFMERPTHFEAPFVSEVTPTASAKSYNAALDVIAYWFAKEGRPDLLQGFSRMDIPGE